MNVVIPMPNLIAQFRRRVREKRMINVPIAWGQNAFGVLPLAISFRKDVKVTHGQRHPFLAERRKEPVEQHPPVKVRAMPKWFCSTIEHSALLQRKLKYV